MCNKLEKGMLLRLNSSEKRGWFHLKSHQRLLRKFKEIPPKFVIGPEVVSLMMRLEGVKYVFGPGDVCVYLGEKKIRSRQGKGKTLRLILVDGNVGFIEGKDIKHLEPI